MESILRNRKDFTETTALPKVTELPKSWVKIFDTLKVLLRTRRGETSTACLLYLIRDDATPIDADFDPRTNYATLDAEMIARCPHWEKNTNGAADVRPPYYESDNAKLWTILLFEIFRDHASYTYMRPFEEAQDGRGAYLSLRSHHLGKSNIAALASEAERELERLRYYGETRTFNFEMYVNAHIQCHNTLLECMKYGHHGLSEQSKIDKFLDGIQTHLMDMPKTSILNDREREGSDYLLRHRCAHLYNVCSN
jgi:hypothetical protein